MTATAQTAVRNAHHSVHQRFCRWLLFALDRLPLDQLTITQETIANMLGVRLRSNGVLRYHRGALVVLDRPQLERQCCESYSAITTQIEQLLPRLRAITLQRIGAVRAISQCQHSRYPIAFNVGVHLQ
jgi:hypothetical protein